MDTLYDTVAGSQSMIDEQAPGRADLSNLQIYTQLPEVLKSQHVI